jgi:hypothetical protein
MVEFICYKYLALLKIIGNGKEKYPNIQKRINRYFWNFRIDVEWMQQENRPYDYYFSFLESLFIFFQQEKNRRENYIRR